MYYNLIRQNSSLVWFLTILKILVAYYGPAHIVCSGIINAEITFVSKIPLMWTGRTNHVHCNGHIVMDIHSSV